ncbi:D-2-hydroxyglutarate dehydrogenase YdiJ [Agrobacterium tumefaciens]|uniref:D-2-hydroxyglutarate dehydrogenase n=1 Tax=Agrobacterium tumefaciens TaxID=358 RepID=A0A2L2LL48_AGRTU|nr:FAD-binding and (Fe-S)-binding domain-containing protein [Agrobacterium tumefaciens]AVH45057.1 FAD-linked oxidase [Agrobacterium tumefaciens]NSY98946.1 FAD-binding oxidoreductase [Agrobacterium tumefaciens]
MIPCLLPHSDTPVPPAGFIERLVESGFCGDIETGTATRTVFATDNSIYQMAPSAVLFPRNVEDLKILGGILAEPGFRHIVIAPRGGGTGTNGQSLTPGVVVDCSRHMTRILEIDPVRRIARVQAGVVKDQLNRALKPYGLFFAPELSTSNRATIGGMVSTDACGQGSCLYGKTSNHVLGLRIVLKDGTDWWSRPLDAAALAGIAMRQDRIGEIHRTVERITREQSDRITEVFPKLNRFMTGYDLTHVRRPDGYFDLNAVLCGSEGTLAMIAEVELNLLPIPAHAALINIRYDDFNTALEDARALTALKVASVETVDEKVLALAKGDIVWNGIARFFPDDASGPAHGINIAELLADDEDELERKLSDVTEALDSSANVRHCGYTIARSHAEIEAIWSMRKRAVGLLGNVEGPVRPVAFVEDTAVPPENLAAYIREFRALLDDAGLSYGMFGHVDAGVLHVRPALDLTHEDHILLVRGISDAVVALTRKYGGVLWGEHGKGVRSEYVPEFFGDLYPCLQDIKQAFDPENRLNPGKIAAPSSASLLKIDEVPLRGSTDRVIGNEIRAAFDDAAYCNGNGACFDFDEASPMCPSYKATRDRRFSPKGRAALMREWLHLLAEKGIDPRQAVDRLRRTNSLLRLPLRVFNTLNPMNRNDFSHEVRAAMDTCLACKACAGQCPVKVSVPAFRSKFLELYYSRYSRPLKDPLVAAIETTLPLMARVRPLYNLFTGTRPGKMLIRLAGLTALPGLPRLTLKNAISHLDVPVATPDLIEAMPDEARKKVVIFIPDAFTAHFAPEVVVAAVTLARKMGLTPFLARTHVNGKALHVHGYLGRFERTAVRTARYLDRLADTGAPLVGLDPSMTLAYRSEYKASLNTQLKAPVLLPQEWLAANLHRLEAAPPPAGRRFRLLAHCTERTNVPASMAQWSAVFRAIGIELEVADVGCCGMAGTFGHEARNRALSEHIYAMSWKHEIGAADGDCVLLATGYSCRSQIKEIAGKAIAHPLQELTVLVCNGLAGDESG